MERFCKENRASGQLCFDFMLNRADGRLYAFECNPRTSSVMLEFHDHPGYAEALYHPEVLLANLLDGVLPKCYLVCQWQVALFAVPYSALQNAQASCG